MAPQMANTKNQTATAVNSTKAATRSGVVKRRYKKVRFHENGSLNVERKTGKYLKIARQNQRDSPLLRLPPEVRHLIFVYVLGGNTFKTRHDQQRRITNNMTKSKHALALLTVCRQVYAETSMLPFSLNTFCASGPQTLSLWIGNLRPAFVEVITAVRIDISISHHTLWFARFCRMPPNDRDANAWMQFSSALTSLKCVQLAVTLDKTLGDIDTKELEREEEYLKGQYELANSGIRFTLTRKTG